MSFYINKKGFVEGATPLTVKALRAAGLKEYVVHTKPVARSKDFRAVFPAACSAMLRAAGHKATTAEVKNEQWDSTLLVTTYPKGESISTWKVSIDDEGSVSVIEA